MVVSLFDKKIENIMINLVFIVGENSYRIYSRISREILDEFWAVFSSFDLYAGHKKYNSGGGG